jgi:hypothetical protein
MMPTRNLALSSARAAERGVARWLGVSFAALFAAIIALQAVALG